MKTWKEDIECFSKEKVNVVVNLVKHITTQTIGKETSIIATIRKIPTSLNNSILGKKSKSMTPPFLLTFSILNMNAHNCLVDSSAYSNVMPYDVSKRINVEPKKTNTWIIQLDRLGVRVMGELKDVVIRFTSNPKVFQVIGIVVVDIHKAYGLLLSKDWSSKLNGYFSTN